MADDAPSLPLGRGAPDGSLLTPVRVLLVQEDKARREVVCHALRELRFHVEEADDGYAAVAFACAAPPQSPYDFIVLDLRGAIDQNVLVLRALRARGVRVPVVVCCEGVSVERRIAAWDNGADVCLGPGASIEEMAACLRGLARRLEIRRVDPLTYADLRLDLEGQRLQRGGRGIPLTRSEFALMLAFLRNPAEVLSRDQLQQALKAGKTKGRAVALEVHIMRLRRKMEAHGKRLIYSVYGRGYVLTENAAGRGHS